MKPKLFIPFCICFLLSTLTIGKSSSVYGQWVTIPDANFASFLQTNYPACMSGNQMDTIAIDSMNILILDIINLNIYDITGVQYFKDLIGLSCGYNDLSFLPSLPSTLQQLNCHSNALTTLPPLPVSLFRLECYFNNITSLPTLPAALKYFDCYDNHLTSLPTLPDSLRSLSCARNELTFLPMLPDSLNELFCDANLLTTVPPLPSGLETFGCSYNNISTLPTLPENLKKFYCSNNSIICLPYLPSSLEDSIHFQISNNLFTCVPNYIPAMQPAWLAMPICYIDDTINNPNNCVYGEVTGDLFKDSINNCSFDTIEPGYHNLSLNIFDSSSFFIGQMYSSLSGKYIFRNLQLSDYTIEIRDANKPYTTICLTPGSSEDFSVTSANLSHTINFDIGCKPGFDVGTQSVYTTGWVFPGQQHALNIITGDISQGFGLNCANGVAGTVQISVNGPVSYNGSASALTPSISGSVYTFNIPDFGLINSMQDFSLLFKTDTSAQTGDSICVQVSVTPFVGDNYISNNSYHYCYNVINSFDPNIKDVYPQDVPPGYDDYFTYTIHFQNTGAAPAFNIRLKDELSQYLDESTLEVISYSHPCEVVLTGKKLSVFYPNIMLTPNSLGFIQYRIRPISGLPASTEINNLANIYFDYNEPITTNTTTNRYVSTSSIEDSDPVNSFRIYPNPTTGILNIINPFFVSINSIEIMNISGRIIKQLLPGSNTPIVDISELSSGIYLVRLNTNAGISVQKIIKN